MTQPCHCMCAGSLHMQVSWTAHLITHYFTFVPAVQTFVKHPIRLDWISLPSEDVRKASLVHLPQCLAHGNSQFSLYLLNE